MLKSKVPMKTTSTLLILLLLTGPATAQSTITNLMEQFGHSIGDDYFLVNYTQLVDYWKKLDRESDRMTVTEIGRTSEGRPMVMAIITSAENQPNLARYKQ